MVGHADNDRLSDCSRYLIPARRAAQCLAELALGDIWLPAQMPQELCPSARETAFGQPIVHASSQHDGELEQTLQQLTGVRGPGC